MFTGIIEEVGSLERLNINGNSGTIKIKASKVLEGTRLGDSISVNGICLTVTKLSDDGFCADVMAETVRRSGLRSLHPGNRVNLERAMSAEGHFGGHIVSGHIDGTGVIRRMERDENAVWITVGVSEELLRGIVMKGSIAIDGVSLTVADVTDSDFSVSVIPHTGEETILLTKRSGDSVNIETDVIGKYVEKMLGGYKSNSGLTMDYLEKIGF
ncbi:MAG: riboflavin synthase [Lachnospiraceae bacterium]|nr:riboflavin synthase [Lachnospiraceae bacterium]